jgi:hypothetical protein
MLLRTLDTLTTRGAQVVLASDRPPAEINGLDARLLSRFSGGLIVDMGLPDYETRVAIMRRKVEERKARLADGVAELLARYPFQNVRELQGALNRLLAIQELEERLVATHELASVLGEQFSVAVAMAEGAGGAEEGAVGGGRRIKAFPSEPEWRRGLPPGDHGRGVGGVLGGADPTPRDRSGGTAPRTGRRSCSGSGGTWTDSARSGANSRSFRPPGPPMPT